MGHPRHRLLSPSCCPPTRLLRSFEKAIYKPRVSTFLSVSSHAVIWSLLNLLGAGRYFQRPILTSVISLLFCPWVTLCFPLFCILLLNIETSEVPAYHSSLPMMLLGYLKHNHLLFSWANSPHLSASLEPWGAMNLSSFWETAL